MLDEKILIEKILKNSKIVGDGITNPYMKAGYKLAHEHTMDIIHLMQTESKPIAPVIPPLKPVVFCKDCRVPHNKFIGCKYMNGLVPPPNHFCSYGQRKD